MKTQRYIEKYENNIGRFENFFGDDGSYITLVKYHMTNWLFNMDM